VVAEVVVERGGQDRIYAEGLPATVRRVLQGSGAVRKLLLRLCTLSSCNHIFDNGHVGLVVGVAQGTHRGSLILEPILVARRDGFTLPKGYVVPDWYRTHSGGSDGVLEIGPSNRFCRPPAGWDRKP